MNYTGHPLVDIGIATIAAFAGKRDPKKLTLEDFEIAADYMEENYVVNPLKSFLTVAFTANSGYSQPAYDKSPEKRKIYTEKILRAYRPDTPVLEKQRCVFTGKPAVAFSLDVNDNLPPGRTFRQHIPLLTGEDVINFHPYGNAGLWVSGEILFALQAFPLGCAKVGGRLLAVHIDDLDLQYRFAKEFLFQNRKLVQYAQLSGEKKLDESPHRATTLLIDTLLKLEDERQETGEVGQPVSVTAYHLSNSGQGADLAIYYLPLEINSFLSAARRPRYLEAWNKLRARGWQIVQSEKKRDTDNEKSQPRFNVLYEDIFKLPDEAPRFIRRYFLRIPERSRIPGDPRITYSLRNEVDLVSWDLTELFLREVMYMDKSRIQQIQTLGDKLAEYVNSENDKKFFNSFLTSAKYSHFRAVLIKMNLSQLKKGQEPVVNFDSYITVFEEGEELPYSNWKLARDLVLIRMIERLYELGWIQANKEQLPEADEINTEE